MKLDFVDAQMMRIKNIETFEAPSKEELDELQIDNFVKVCIGGERFWVIVKGINDEKVSGIITNDLVKTHIHGLINDDVVEFEKRHIFDILDDE